MCLLMLPVFAFGFYDSVFTFLTSTGLSNNWLLIIPWDQQLKLKLGSQKVCIKLVCPFEMLVLTLKTI